MANKVRVTAEQLRTELKRGAEEGWTTGYNSKVATLSPDASQSTEAARTAHNTEQGYVTHSEELTDADLRKAYQNGYRLGKQVGEADAERKVLVHTNDKKALQSTDEKKLDARNQLREQYDAFEDIADETPEIDTPVDDRIQGKGKHTARAIAKNPNIEKGHVAYELSGGGDGDTVSQKLLEGDHKEWGSQVSAEPHRNSTSQATVTTILEKKGHTTQAPPISEQEQISNTFSVDKAETAPLIIDDPEPNKRGGTLYETQAQISPQTIGGTGYNPFEGDSQPPPPQLSSDKSAAWDKVDEAHNIPKADPNREQTEDKNKDKGFEPGN